jgi:hypothetical protein
MENKSSKPEFFTACEFTSPDGAITVRVTGRRPENHRHRIIHTYEICRRDARRSQDAVGAGVTQRYFRPFVKAKLGIIELDGTMNLEALGHVIRQAEHYILDQAQIHEDGVTQERIDRESADMNRGKQAAPAGLKTLAKRDGAARAIRERGMAGMK